MISVKVLLIVCIALSYSTIANAFELKCKFSMKTDYSCDVQSLRIDLPHTKITSVSRTHLEDNENEDVKYLGITDQSIKFLPINLAQYFINLKKIQVKNSKLEYITKNDFLGLTQLTHIVMGDNIIKELPCGVFDTNTRLQQLYFTKNDLGKIGKDIFNPLPLLSLAHFRKNVCVDKDADKIEQVPGLRNEIAKKCATDCKKTGAYPALIKSCDSEYYQVIINELGKTVYTLNYKVDNLESNLDDQKEEYEQLNEEKENLEQVVINLNATNEGLTKDVNACMDENLKLTKEKDELDKQISKLETKLSKSIEDAKVNDEKLNTIINDKENNITAKIEEVKALGDKVDSLEKDLDDSKIENLRINKENDELKKQISELGLKLSKSIEDALESYEKLNIIIMDKEENIIAKIEEIKTLGDKMDSLEKDLDASKIENLIINKENDKLNKEISEMRLKLSKSTQDAKNNDKKLNDIIINKNKIIVKNNGEIKKLKTDLNNANASNKNLQKALAASKAEIKNLIKNKNELLLKIKGLEIKLKKSVDDSNNLKKIIQSKDKIINNNKVEIKNLGNKVNAASAINLSLTKDLNVSKAETIKINEEKEKLNQFFKELEMKYEKTIEDANQNEEKLMGTIVNKNNEIVGLETNIQNINDTLGTAETNWTIRCINDDLNNCYSKNFSIAVESCFDYTKLKTFYEYKNDTDFRIENSKMTYLSNSFFKHYPMMKYFFVTASQLQSIKNGNFLDAGQLLQITITRNQIRTVEDSTFEGAKNVEILNLGSNRIESLSDKALTGLKKLKDLNLSNNKIESLKQGIFVNLQSMESLHMDGNSITALSGKLFKNNPRLTRVYFNSNKLKIINPQIIQNLSHLNYINLRNNSCINKEYKELTPNSRIVKREIHQLCSNILKS